MGTLNQNELLDKEIFELRKKRNFELINLTNQYQLVIESIKPSNIIKQTFAEVTEFNSKNNFILKSLTGFLGGYISKKIFVGKSKSSIKTVIGNVLQYSISTLINRYSTKKILD